MIKPKIKKAFGDGCRNAPGRRNPHTPPKAFCVFGAAMDNKSPAFQFYPSDFLSDEKVMLMTNQEVGCYIKLLCINWKQGSIPDDVEKLAKLCGEDGTAMAQLWQSVGMCFETNGKPGRLINKRIEKERKKQEEYRKTKSESGKLGAHNRWNKLKENGNAMVLPMANDSSSSSSSISKRIYSPNSDEFRLSELLLKFILERRNGFKKPDLQKWAVHIDKMIRIDKRPTSEIEQIIRWCQKDNFWQNNILSTDKLRVQYDKLALKAIKPEPEWK
jgi:uncharacterized protein YdaU (DUF1376 family)